jgi:hypothetical protein
MLLLTVSCSGDRDIRAADGRMLDGPADHSSERPTRFDDGILAGYPPGGWRLAPAQERDHVYVWLSHILVMHSQSEQGSMAFLRLTSWAPDLVPQRSAREAFARALRVAEEAKRGPSRFAALAREYSDDALTRDQGGSLGGALISQIPARFLDAVAAMHPGDVSRPIRTRMGYHVLLLRVPPSEAAVAGARIVVRYRGTVGAGRPSQRSRAEAERIAGALFAETAHETFAKLAEERSDAADAIRSGDLGVWSVREPESMGRELEVLEVLDLNQVSRPIDSRYGFEILKRVAVTPQAAYAASVIQLPYDEEAPSEASVSKSQMQQLAEVLAAQVERAPSSFDSQRQRYCCVEPLLWTAGRGPLKVETVVPSLQMGAIHARAIDTGDAFIIAKRVDPATVRTVAPAYVLPTPELPDFAAIAANTDGRFLAMMVRQMSKELSDSKELAEAPSTLASVILEHLARTYEHAENSEVKVVATRQLNADLIRELGPVQSQRCLAFIHRWSTAKVLANPEP